MRLFSLPNSTRGQLAMAAVHVAMLAVALAMAWQHDGPPADKAFRAILAYFVEIALAGVVEVTVACVQAVRARSVGEPQSHEPPLDRPLRRHVSAAEIERVARDLPVAAAPPDRKMLRCVGDAPGPLLASDGLGWSLWQDRRTDQLWVHCTGGIAFVDVWYGPGEGAVAAEAGAA